MPVATWWADERATPALGIRPSACRANRPVSGWGQGRQPPEAVARSASLEASRSRGYVKNTVAPWRRIRLASIAGELAARTARLDFATLRRLDTSHGCRDHLCLPYAHAP